jgi:peptide/nickel transport system substrate-binding protein
MARTENGRFESFIPDLLPWRTILFPDIVKADIFPVQEKIMIGRKVEMMSGRTCCIVVILAALSTAFGCAGDRTPERRGGTLVVGEPSAYEGLNPFSATDAHARDIYNLIFLSMLDENDDFLTFRPRLAESWEFSNDRKELTFHLRRDVVWNDGVPFTAHDVLATFKAQKDTALAWSGRHLKEHIDEVHMVDDHTVVYHFSHVYPYQVMDANDGPIFPRHYLENKTPEEIRSAKVEEIPSNGPFRVGEWIRGQSLTLVPYENYYEEGKPYLDKVIFKIVPDQVNLINQLKSGEVDCMESIPPIEVDKLRKEESGIKIYSFPSRAYLYVGWNGQHPLFVDKRIRRAMTMAIDRKEIIDNLYYGLAIECRSPFIPQMWAYNSEIEAIPYDPDRAVEMLKEVGFTDSDGDGWLDRGGERLEFEMITNHGVQIRNDILVMIQEHLGRIGVKVEPVLLEWTVMLEKHKKSDFESILSGWRVGTKVDLAPIWSCESRGLGGYNRVDYCNSEVDRLNSIACGILDFNEARPLFFRAQEIIYEEQPYTFLLTPSERLALHERFEGAVPDAISNYHNLHEWRIDSAGR